MLFSHSVFTLALINTVSDDFIVIELPSSNVTISASEGLIRVVISAVLKYPKTLEILRVIFKFVEVVK